jgi:coenzyme F420-reducing hydrogenase beta subunit
MKRKPMSVQDPDQNTSSQPGKGPKELREEVLDTGLCTACGMCLGLCPYLEELGENVAFISDCRGDQGRCYAVCPRTDTDLDALRELYAPDMRADFVLGPHQSIWMARAKKEEVRHAAQYGGTVTALALFGIETGRVDTALLTDWSRDPEEPYLPKPLVAKTREEVLSASGSKYTASPTLKVLDSILKEEAAKALVVGRPCQVLALRKRMRIEDPTFRREHIALVIGLFCMWSLSYRDFRKMVAPLADAKQPTRIDVPKGRFVVETDEGSVELDHDSVRSHSRETCQSCYDFTSELADLSVGSTEWKDDWNTLIARSEAGRTFLEAAVQQGWIELEPLPEERLHLLREASFNKKQRVLEQIEQEAERRGTRPYLRIGQEEKDFFLRTHGPTVEE